MSALPLLSLLIFTPWVGAALLAAFGGKLPVGASRALGLVFSASTLVLAACALAGFAPDGAYQFVERHAWIRALSVEYHLGLDGLSLLLVLLTGVVAPLCLLASWRVERAPHHFAALFLLLQGAALGVFLALDFFHWFLFWELSLVPAFFLIKLWGGPKATPAAYQFVIYTLAGGACLLVGFVALAVAAGTMSFPALAAMAATGQLAAKLAALGGYWPLAIFIGVFLGLAVKAPVFPLHTWLPATYAEAPVGVSMFLTAVMSKMGVYGFLRILWPLFPQALHDAAPVLLGLALGGVVLGAFAAMKQSDLKRMVAYSSINHVSYCLLALFAVAGVGAQASHAPAATAALSGALLQMFNHGLSAAALFACVGMLESRSGGKRGLGDFGGVRTVAPVFAGLCGVSLFSSLGLPGLNGFVGEFLIFSGVFGLAPWAAGVACLGLLATALFLLTFWQRVFHGPGGPGVAAFADLDRVEVCTLVPLAVLMLVLGVWPQALVGLVNPLVTGWVAQLP